MPKNDKAHGQMFPRNKKKAENYHDPRTSTDVMCCRIFCVACVLAIALVVFSWFHGDPKRLLHEMDYAGRLCGVDAGVEDKPFLYHCGMVGLAGKYPRKLNYDSRTCVASCPNGTADKIPCVLPADIALSMPAPMTLNNLTWTKTQQFDVTQTVTLMNSYPSEAYPGRFCVPLGQSNSSIREDLISGPLGSGRRLQRVVGSFRKVWWIVLIVAALAILLGILYIVALSKIAGFFMLISTMVAALLVLCLGLFLVFDLQGGYQSHNPIVRSITGGAGLAASIFLGFFLIAQAVCLACAAYRGVKDHQIDYVVGIIHSALECIFSGNRLIWAAIGMSLGIVLVVFLLFAGLTIICSVGYLDVTMSINEEKVTGLLKKFQWYDGWGVAFFFYCVIAIWICEVMINWWQFTVVYTVCIYYFVEKTKSKNADSKKMGTSAVQGTYKNVKLGPIDGISTKGEHQGMLQNSEDGGKTLVVPLGIGGPDGRPWWPHDEDHLEKVLPAKAIPEGLWDGLRYHLGTFATGAIYGNLTRPLRLVVTGFRAMTSGNVQYSTGGDIDSDDGGLCQALLQVFSRILTMVDDFLSGYSEAAYNDVVLRSQEFVESAKSSIDFIEATGGSISILFGKAHVYELVGVILISTICGFVSLVVMNLPWFSDPSKESLFVPNPYEMTLLTVFLCGIIAYIFLSLVSIGANTLLFAFAWARQEEAEAKNKALVPSSMLPIVGKDMALSAEAIPLDKKALEKRRAEKFRLAVDKLATATGKAGSTATSQMGTFREKSPLLSSMTGYAPVANHP